MKKREIELLLTGFFLGSAQVGTYFHLLLAEGGSPTLYFLLILFWLLGSLTGMFVFAEKRAGLIYKTLCLFFYLVTTLMCEYAEQLFFSVWVTVVVLFCAYIFGMFAGWFFQNRVETYKDARFVLLHENNGFILGYATSAALLFFSSDFTNGAVFLFGLLLFLCPEPGQEIQKQ